MKNEFKKKLTTCFVICLQLLLIEYSNAQNNQSNTIPPNGVLVDAGGHRLHLNIIGKGSPAVIFENGSADFSFIWSLVQPKIAAFTKTVAYDRAGYAWSDVGPMPRTARQICFELHTALKNAGVKPPYILVGQSFGGFLIRAFARYYPKEIVGMVLVEAVQEDQRIFMGSDTPMKIRDFAKGRKEPPIQTFFKPADSSVSFTLNKEIDPLFNKFPDSIKELQIWAQSHPLFIRSVQAEMDWSPEDVADLYKHKDDPSYMLGNIPLIVLTRGKGGYDGRRDSLELETERLYLQKKLASLSTNHKFIIDNNSGHNIHLEDPQTVINTIHDVFEAAKNHRPLKQ